MNNNQTIIDKSTNRLGFILAGIAGILALGLTFIFLQQTNTGQESPQTVVRRSASKRVMAAARDLASNHVIVPNVDLKVIEIPIDGEYEGFINNCVPENHLNELRGRRIGAPVPANYPVLYSNLTSVTQLDFSSGVLKTVSLAPVNFFSSHLIPGDRVDVLVTMPKPQPKESASRPAAGASFNEVMAAALEPLTQERDREMVTKVILENAEIFMVGPLITASRDLIGLNPPENINDSTEVTFRLSRDDAIMLTNYANTPGATISLLMRPRPPKDIRNFLIQGYEDPEAEARLVPGAKIVNGKSGSGNPQPAESGKNQAGPTPAANNPTPAAPNPTPAAPKDGNQ